ncbi:MAG: hypothetical protein LBS19_07200 [Clostridiales bacterium]|jgi:hypothetical protein|nr:hypothetical protein [Clostridiales bacterium]
MDPSNVNNKRAAFSGSIMRKDAAVAKVINNSVQDVTESAPIYIKNYMDFPEWLKDRGADLTRSNMRVILKKLGIPAHDAVAAVKYANAASLTDEFWIKPQDSALTYEDTVFKNNLYFKAAASGDPDIFGITAKQTPELTNIGSFEKGWKLENGKWFLYKSGNPLQRFSEIFASALARLLGLDAVEYWVKDGFVVCENFVRPGYCLELAKSFIWDDLDYRRNAEWMHENGFLRQYMDLIFTDVIVRNADRHEFNYGVLTSAAGIVSLAPNFDNNLSLFHNGIPSNLSRDDIFVSDFNNALDYARRRFAFKYTLPPLAEGLVREAFSYAVSSAPVEVPENSVVSFCMNAFNRINK